MPDDPEHVLGKLTHAAEMVAELAESAVSVRLIDASVRPSEGASPPLPDTSSLLAKLVLEVSLEVSESASVTLIALGLKGYSPALRNLLLY